MNAVMNKNEMRIYVADLACYNNGILSGAWIDLPYTHHTTHKLLSHNTP